MKRVQIIKKQAISAFDPRVIEVTGISMMLPAQCAEHTTENLPGCDCNDKTIEELAAASMDIQANCAAVDSVGIFVFGRSMTNVNHDFIGNALNYTLVTEFNAAWFYKFGIETLKLEDKFNEKPASTRLRTSCRASTTRNWRRQVNKPSITSRRSRIYGKTDTWSKLLGQIEGRNALSHFGRGLG